MTGSDAVDVRHLSAEGFDQYVNNRVPMTLPVPGTPVASIFINPVAPELGLRIEIPSVSAAPDTGLSNIETRITTFDGAWYLEVVVTSGALFRDAYPVLCAMIDRVQLDGMKPVAALRATLAKLSSLLLSPATLSREREVGLFGELLVLAGLLGPLGARDAVHAWRGGDAEEHDFGLPTLDIEVKTTSSERRTHWIESVTQLVPTGDRPLWVISHQITSAGAGTGWTLPELVDAVRDQLSVDALRDRFDAELVGSGWYESARDQLSTVWTRRSPSATHAVIGDFPRLTPEAIRTDRVPMSRISEVKYRINLDGLETTQPVPDIVSRAAEFEG
ncbi:PD-(D/E)XK motif protein [Nocardia neocaledoniensis]|uniref:PD-(D/E)XK motif protein n=1 Tax=Nocardia neocaledoniensis TaxID=236511 RepID=UPI0024542FFA|nr:PD-(D/E)XK motif protein [Nocardia neocaledoniensis]